MKKILNLFNERNIFIGIAIIASMIFSYKFFGHLREVPRGDIAIFLATLTIIWHVNKIVGFIYDAISSRK